MFMQCFTTTSYSVTQAAVLRTHIYKPYPSIFVTSQNSRWRQLEELMFAASESPACPLQLFIMVQHLNQKASSCDGRSKASNLRKPCEAAQAVRSRAKPCEAARSRVCEAARSRTKPCGAADQPWRASANLLIRTVRVCKLP